MSLSLQGVGAVTTPPRVEQLDPPARAVQDLLDLRTERSADASAYAEYLLDPDVARELAAADAEETSSTASPTPAWEEPYVADTESDRVEVVVVWVPDGDHPDWPFATVFVMEDDAGLWKAADAEALADEEGVPAPAD